MTPATFCEQFATFAEAPHGVAKLRELILQLAVSPISRRALAPVFKCRSDSKPMPTFPTRQPGLAAC